MCGIFGALARDPADPVDAAVLECMASALTHRGPDGGGIHADGPLGFGMRRLSIIDLKTGEQPMANEDSTVWVVYNGEIYNYRELTGQLVRKGHRFNTASDTEVLVHLYEDEGEDCVRQLRGMFGFAIWDATHRRLLLARDRLGIKPLYYADTPRGFVFASELKALTRNPWVPRTINRRALLAYLQYGYVPDPLCILEGVAKLPPGHTLTIQAGRAGTPHRYWDATEWFRPGRPPVREAEAAEALWSQLGDAVTSHLVSDVPLGAFLSGGVDSTAVVSIMARTTEIPVKTFTVGFREERYNEAPYARRVAEAFGTDHHELLVGPQDLGILDDLVAAYDEPFADASAIPTYLVSRYARQHVKVVLSGDGGDELFAGYDRYLVDARRRRLGVLGDLRLGGGLRGLSQMLPEGTPGKNYLHNLSLPRMERYLDAISLFPPRQLGELLEPSGNADGDPFAPHIARGQGLDSLSQLQVLDLHTYLPGDILTKLDRASMAHSLEARVPLLDHRLVELAGGLPPELRLRSGRTKYLLRRVLARRVPEEVLKRPKQGFAVPLDAWFAQGLAGYFHDLLQSGRSVTDVGVKRTYVRRLLDLYAKRRRNDHCQRLWALVVLDKTLRKLADPGR
jgi:asparagine synthase (glutamine-hydrolysing)